MTAGVATPQPLPLASSGQVYGMPWRVPLGLGLHLEENHVVTEGVHLSTFEADTGLHVQLSEVDGVHHVAGGNALDGVEDVGIGVGCGRLSVQISAEVRQNVALRLIEVRHGPKVPAEIVAVEEVPIILEAALKLAQQKAGSCLAEAIVYDFPWRLEFGGRCGS